MQTSAHRVCLMVVTDERGSRLLGGMCSTKALTSCWTTLPPPDASSTCGATSLTPWQVMALMAFVRRELVVSATTRLP